MSPGWSMTSGILPLIISSSLTTTGLISSCLRKIESWPCSVSCRNSKNIIRHARASLVRISLHCLDTRIRLSIADDGRGFDARTTPQGLGLSHIYERARLYQGEVTLETAPGCGCLLTVEMPIAV